MFQKRFAFFRIEFLVLGLLLLPLGPTDSSAGNKAPAQFDWPIVRGNPLQSGVAPSPLPDKLEILWRFQAKDAFEGTAAIVDGVVYVGNYDENLYAIDLNKGQEKWRYKAGPIKAAPGYYKGKVYVGDENGIFHCVDAATGKPEWTFETNGEITCGANFAGDRVLFGSYDSTLYCLSLDGKKLWDAKTEGPVNGSPVVVGDITFVAGCDSSLHIINVKDGKELDKVDLGGQAAATGAVIDNHLYVGTMTDQVLSIDLKQREVVWTFELEVRSQAFYSSAAVTDDLVVVGCRNRTLYALDRKTGKERWTFDTKGRVDPSPVVAGKRVYAAALDGKLYVLNLADGKLVESFALGEQITGSPAVSNNRLVIGTTDGVLYCLGNK
jgi:outer membrane protein assembly factor BamB